jgi:purine-binding chemotaxis protein CheW
MVLKAGIAPPCDVLVFSIERVRYALRLDAVDRVLPMVALTPLVSAPEVVAGALSLHGEPLPVLDIRRRFGLPLHRYEQLSARLIIASTRRRRVAIPADEVLGVAQVEIMASERLAPGLPYVEGVAALEDGLLFVHDLGTFLSLDEEAQLDAGLAGDPA